MTTLNLVDFQTDWIDAPDWTTHDRVGFELGWDYARYRVGLPEPYVQAPSPLREGVLAAESTFGSRTLAPTPAVRQWLQLRLHAWLRGRSVELVQVTPNYLQQIATSHCPITRRPLGGAAAPSSDTSIDRVRNDAGYAAGNLAVMSAQANHAKGSLGFRELTALVRRLQAQGQPRRQGLGVAQWQRVAVLSSFVEPLPHHEAVELPLLVIPPNRLRLFNPAQALQAFVSLQLLKPGWSQRLARFEALLPNKLSQRDFKRFFMAMLPRVIEAGRLGASPQARWGVEDAWRSPSVQLHWARFAGGLTAADCESLLMRAVARKLGTTLVASHPPENATEGWNLSHRGYVPYAAAWGPSQDAAMR